VSVIAVADWRYRPAKPSDAVFTSSYDCGDEVAHEGLGCSAIIYPRHRCATKKLPEVPFLAQFIIFSRQDQ
jgi:hypothetical protein